MTIVGGGDKASEGEGSKADALNDAGRMGRAFNRDVPLLVIACRGVEDAGRAGEDGKEVGNIEPFEDTVRPGNV